MGSGCGSVGRAVAFDTRRPSLESSHFIGIREHVFIWNWWKEEKGIEAGQRAELVGRMATEARELPERQALTAARTEFSSYVSFYNCSNFKKWSICDTHWQSLFSICQIILCKGGFAV